MRGEVTARILNKEILLLIVLSLVAVGVFLFTRTMAAREQRMELRIARIWYDQGMQYITSGQVEKAILAFRKSTEGTPLDQKYALALANALAAGNHDAEAQQLLLQLRESDPENAQINIYLARVTSRHGETSDAVRYYRNALYGRWNGAQIDERQRRLRAEFIRFLLEHQEPNLASSELLILETELPDSASSWVETARLFIQAGDLRHALKDYSEAARLDSHNVEALTGAGETSFRLGDYINAKKYLTASSDQAAPTQNVRQQLLLAEMVLAQDPMAPHLTSEERQHRLIADFTRSLQRLDACIDQNPDSAGQTELQSLKTEALGTEPELNQRKHPPDSDMIGADMSLIVRMQKATSDSCGKPADPDQALILIGLQHNGARP